MNQYLRGHAAEAERMPEPDGLSEIEIVLDEQSVNDQVVAAIAQRGDVFDSAGHLAVIGSDGDGQTIVRRLAGPNVRELITATVNFIQVEINKKDGDERTIPKRIPRWCYEAVQKRGQWKDIPAIRGVVTCPVLRPDGTILQVTGFDAATGLYLDLRTKFPPIPQKPSAADVSAAVDILLAVVADFPFAEDAHRAAWLAGVLTPLAREAHHGTTGPLFMADGNVRGVGKTLLIDLVSIIVKGCSATRMTSPARDDEARKRITSLVDAGERIVLIDNVTGRFGCEPLDAALTGTVWKDRKLGSQDLIEAQLRMTWFASGNNVILQADTARRVCHIRLESPDENPEDRSGFKHPDIREHVRKRRPELLSAALTILRGYIAAGRPELKLKPWGSFEQWSGLVRSAVVWAGLADPAETRDEVRMTADSEAGALRQAIHALDVVDPDRHGLRAADLIKISRGGVKGYGTEAVELLRDALEELCETNIKTTSSQKLGTRLSHFRSRIVEGQCFDFRTTRGTRYWFIRGGDSGCDGGPVGVELREKPETDGSTIPRHAPDTDTTSTTATTDVTWLDNSKL